MEKEENLLQFLYLINDIVHDSQLGFQEVVESCGPRGKEDRLL